MGQADFPITLYHNPDCGTSRNVLAILRAAGYAPTVVEYRKVGWTRPQLEALFAAMGVSPCDLLRQKGPAEEMGLLAEGVDGGAVLDAMVAHPILVERPIVVTPKGVALCRPYARVLPLLERRPERFTRSDGVVVELGAAG